MERISTRFIWNKYYRWYLELISVSDAEGYVERHHKTPRALGGSNRKQNLVFLSARKHFLAHWLLTKFTVGKDKQAMFHAFACMSRNPNGERVLSSWQYELARKARQEALRGQPSPMKGKTTSLEARAKQSRAHKGKVLTEEHKQNITKGLLLVGYKMANVHKGKKKKLEHVIKATAHMKGNKYRLGYKSSEETRIKVSQSLLGNTRKLGYKDPPEVRAKKSKSKIGNKNRLGTYPTKETLRLLSISQKAAWARRKAHLSAFSNMEVA